MKECLIISGGKFSKFQHLIHNKYIIACDHGYEYAKKENIKPNLIIGDFDSYTDELPNDIEIIKLDCKKDDTDTMSAIRYAIKNGCENLTITCATGNRVDHTMANIQSAIYAVENNINVNIIEEDTKIYFLKNNRIKIEKKEGFSLSILSVTDKSTGVNIKNTKYVLENGEITSSFPIGISNEWDENYANISVEKGILMIILSKI